MVIGPAVPAAATDYCIHSWAKPGRYTVTGELQDRVQSTTAYLTNGCRVNFSIPGVFTGGPVAPAGDCVQFSFRVRDVAETFVAHWCDSYAVVPWRGSEVRVGVSRSRQQ